MDNGIWIAIGVAVISFLGLIATYFGYILRMEHRLTKVETIFEFIPFPKLFDLMQTMLNKIPSSLSSNPYDRRGELLSKLQRQLLTYQEAVELRDLVARDIESSNQDEIIKALILIGIGILIAYVLSQQSRHPNPRYRSEATR